MLRFVSQPSQIAKKRGEVNQSGTTGSTFFPKADVPHLAGLHHLPKLASGESAPRAERARLRQANPIRTSGSNVCLFRDLNRRGVEARGVPYVFLVLQMFHDIRYR